MGEAEFISETQIVLRLAVAAALACLVGADRERHEWTAGMRTYMLVGVGAALAMIVSINGFEVALAPGAPDHVRLDPSRMASQVIVGVGFLGAGAILTRNHAIHGLTTAAGIWAVAAMGLAVGAGMYIAAAAATIIVLVILVALKPIESWLYGRSRSRLYRLRVSRGALTYADFGRMFPDCAQRVARFVVSPREDGRRDDVEIVVTRFSPDELERIGKALHRLPQVESLTEEDEPLA